MGTYRPRSRTPGGRLLYMLLGVAAFAALLLWASPRGAAFGFTPFLLILLLCPFLHFFMHRGHGSADRNKPADGEGVHRH